MKTLVKIVLVAVIGGAIGVGIGRMLAPTKEAPPETPLGKLEWGNASYAKGKPTAPRRDKATRERLATEGQKPFAIVITCSDSRVPPEIILDQGLGDLFVVRVAGNVVGELEIASIEYAVAHLEVPLIITLGHTECGAVKASVQEGKTEGNLPALIKQIKPAVETVKRRWPYLKDEVLVERVIHENVRQTLRTLWNKSEVVRTHAEAGKLSFAGGVYDLFTGTIEWVELPTPLDEYRAQSDAKLEKDGHMEKEPAPKSKEQGEHPEKAPAKHTNKHTNKPKASHSSPAKSASQSPHSKGSH